MRGLKQRFALYVYLYPRVLNSYCSKSASVFKCHQLSISENVHSMFPDYELTKVPNSLKRF